MDIEYEKNIYEGYPRGCDIEGQGTITENSCEKILEGGDGEIGLSYQISSESSKGGVVSQRSYSNKSSKSNDSTQSKRKYIKKVFLQVQKLSKHEKDTLKPQELKILPLYEFIQDKFEFVLIGGDYIYKLTRGVGIESLNSCSINDAERNIMAYKDILNIQKNKQYLTLELQNKFAGIIDFSSFISAIDATIIQLSGKSNLKSLLEFQKMLYKNHETIKQIINYYPDHTMLLNLQSARLQFFQSEAHKIILRDYSEDDFLLTGTIMVSFEKQVPSLRNLSFNKALVSLIGSDFDALQQFFLRKGVKEFFDFSTRVIIQSHHISGIINKRNQHFTSPFTLITYDDIHIQCKIEIETLFLEVPNELKYQTKIHNNSFEVHEGSFIIRIVLSPEQIQAVMSIRNEGLAMQHSTQKTEQIRNGEDICYNMQSQYLMEKYYQEELQKISVEPLFSGITMNGQNESEKGKLTENDRNQQDDKLKRCNFKLI